MEKKQQEIVYDQPSVLLRRAPAMSSLTQASDESKPGEPGQSSRASLVGELTPLVHLEPQSTGDYRYKRWQLLEELIEHEDKYRRSLQFLTYDLLRKENDAILERSKMQDMLAYLPEILVLHQRFRCWMEVTAKNWEVKDMAGWFLGAMLEQPALLKTYSMFAINYTHARTTFRNEVKENPAFRAFLNNKMTQEGAKLDLEAYMFKPLHRMIHLKALIQRLIRHTPSDHSDTQMLQMAFKRVVYILSHLNTLEDYTESHRSMMERDFPFGVPQAAYTHYWRQSQLLQCQDLPVHDRNGSLKKLRRAVLLNDRVLYASVINDDSTSNRFATVQRLKWMLPLQEIDFQIISPRDLMHVPKPEDVYMLMLMLIRDYATVHKIGSLESSLIFSIDDVYPIATGSILDKLKTEMQKLNDVAKAVEECHNSCELVLATKRKTIFRRRKYSLQFPDPASKRQWYCNARLAQRAMRSAPYSSVWWTDVDQLFATYEPAFVDKLSPGIFHDHSKLTCGCYYAPNLAAPLYVRQPLRDWLRNRHTLWICTFGGANTTVTLYTHELLSNALVQRTQFFIDNVHVKCIVHVPRGRVVLNDFSTEDTVWMGSKYQLMIYSGSYPLLDKQLMCVSIKGRPVQMLHSTNRVYVGLKNGDVLIFYKGPTNWNVQMPLEVKVCDHPIASLLPINGDIFVAAGTSVSVIDGKTDRLRIKIKDEDEHGEAEAQKFTPSIICMAYSVHGVWLVRHKSCLVSLYRLSPWGHLQDIDVTGPVWRFSQFINQPICEGKIFVTSIALVDNSLWFGTSVGATMMMALPARRNVPLIGDFIYGAKHGHLGSVNMLMPLMLESDKLFNFNSDGEGVGYDAYDLLRTENDEASTSSIYETIWNATSVGLLPEQSSSTGAKPKPSKVHGSTAWCLSKHMPSSIESASSTGTIPKPPENVSLASESTPQLEGEQVPNTNDPTTMLILAGGEGYLNWHKKEALKTAGYPVDPRFGPIDPELLDDASVKPHILVWEKRLNEP